MSARTDQLTNQRRKFNAGHFEIFGGAHVAREPRIGRPWSRDRFQSKKSIKIAFKKLFILQDYDTDVSRMEFLAFLPYFLYLEEMT